MDTSNTNHPNTFEKVVKHLLQIEGGYSDDPLDNGGETKYGISKRQYPHININALTEQQAIQIYYQDYWLAYQCDKLPPALGCFLFDSVVNHRPKTAVKFVQVAFRLIADGIVGPKTLGAVRTACASSDLTRRLLALCLSYRADFYHDLVNEHPDQERFLIGWFKRLFLLQQFIEQEVLA